MRNVSAKKLAPRRSQSPLCRTIPFSTFFSTNLFSCKQWRLQQKLKHFGLRAAERRGSLIRKRIVNIQIWWTMTFLLLSTAQSSAKRIIILPAQYRLLLLFFSDFLLCSSALLLFRERIFSQENFFPEEPRKREKDSVNVIPLCDIPTARSSRANDQQMLLQNRFSAFRTFPFVIVSACRPLSSVESSTSYFPFWFPRLLARLNVPRSCVLDSQAAQIMQKAPQVHTICWASNYDEKNHSRTDFVSLLKRLHPDEDNKE